VTETWIDVCAADDIDAEDVIEVQAAHLPLAVYRSPQDTFHATDAHCTHGRANLADGLVMGDVIECPKHNGRFDYRTGAAVRVPCLVALVTYQVRVEDGRVLVALPPSSGDAQAGSAAG
jgi:3-phenylpropionate/trans-cinnamate dioxygenase ferredoxin component